MVRTIPQFKILTRGDIMRDRDGCVMRFNEKTRKCNDKSFSEVKVLSACIHVSPMCPKFDEVTEHMQYKKNHYMKMNDQSKSGSDDDEVPTIMSTVQCENVRN